MGEDQKVSFPTGAGQPQQTPVATGEVKGTEYLTREEARALEERILNAAKGYSDKGIASFEKRVKSRLDEVNRNATALGLTDEQKEAARNKIIAEELQRDEPAQPASQHAPAQVQAKGQPQNDDLAAYANAGAKRLEKKYGVSLTTTDPEAASLPQSGDPDTWLDAYETALQAKKQRAEIPPQARITTMPGGSIPAMSQDAMLAEIEAWNQHPDPAKMQRIRELRAKLNQG